MIRGANEQETLRLNGWGVGTRLLGTERTQDWWCQTIIEVTHLNRNGRGILARTISQRTSSGRYDCGESDDERSWTLDCRDWSLISDDQTNAAREVDRKARETGEVGSDVA